MRIVRVLMSHGSSAPTSRKIGKSESVTEAFPFVNGLAFSGAVFAFANRKAGKLLGTTPQPMSKRPKDTPAHDLWDVTIQVCVQKWLRDGIKELASDRKTSISTLCREILAREVQEGLQMKDEVNRAELTA